ncbi:olfactory receptor 13G1-like [Alligator mississippiensis]|uniref:olfactory receptor 13G1-like n=1 Tax=Alligator mississippiensis TaxID=8496 RepID=UPI002877CB29|nr:olfactory receptor 13G1-like [Alligator mississippiensis]
MKLNLNNTRVSEFIMEGLFGFPHLHGLFFGVILCLFMAAVQGNSLIILAIVFHPPLHKPMYFFIANLAVLDIFCTSSVLPKMMQYLILGKKSISFNDCLAQLFSFTFSAATELVLLSTMAFDRYMAICHPLHYVTIMTKRMCIILAVCTWALGAINSFVHTLLMLPLDFCGPNLIQHFFCEIQSLLALSCSSTYLNQVMAFMANIFLAMLNFFLITMSYGFIIRSILKIQSSEGKQRAFSTCSSHLVVVGLYYSTIIYTYIRPPSSYSLENDKMVAILYTLVTPVLNPLIYSLRNKEVKVAFRKVLAVCKRNSS